MGGLPSGRSGRRPCRAKVASWRGEGKPHLGLPTNPASRMSHTGQDVGVYAAGAVGVVEECSRVVQELGQPSVEFIQFFRDVLGTEDEHPDLSPPEVSKYHVRDFLDLGKPSAPGHLHHDGRDNDCAVGDP